MRLTAFNYGTTEITERMAFPAGSDKIKIPISLLFFLIEDGEKKILVDVGCDTMPGFELFTFKKPVEVLEACGVDRRDITDVVLTHSHHDHIDAVRYYPQATVYLHKDALENAGKYLANSKNVLTFDDSIKITDNVELKYIGGHSAGSSIVLLKANEEVYALCGDECYTKENFTNNIPTGSSVCVEKSRAFVKEYRSEKYTPVLFHDIEVLPEIGHRVLFEN